MKFVHALLLLSARAGRPSSSGALFSTDVSDETASTNVSAKCVPQNTQIDGDWQTPCVTKEECCSGRIQKSVLKENNRWIFVCGCIPNGEEWKTDKRDCCSGVANGKTCGCIPPDHGPQEHLQKRVLPLSKEDCCYDGRHVPDDSAATARGIAAGFSPGEFKKCGPRPCQAPGSSRVDFGWWLPFSFNRDKRHAICCGGAKEMDAYAHFVKICKCIPSGTVVSSHLETVHESFCCSRRYDDALTSNQGGNHTCACIPSFEKLPGLGATKSDCCSRDAVPGQGDEKEYLFCKSTECVAPHKLKRSGEVCCTDRKKSKDVLTQYAESLTSPSDDTFCGCVKGGKEIKPGHEFACCSGKSKEGKCTFLSVDTKINPSYMTEDECFSGRTDGADRCLCMKPNSGARGDVDATDKHECCSGQLNNAAKRCSCVHAATALKVGAETDDCCSELVHPKNPELCDCGPIGAKFKDVLGMDKRDCCSSDHRGGFCACRMPDTLTPHYEDGKLCCGPYNGTHCGCRREGSSIPHGTSADVCCSKKAKEVADTAAHAGHCKAKRCV